MNQDYSNERAGVPVWFWILGAIALVWNLLGLLAFAGQMLMTEEALASLPEDQQAIYRNIPTWVNVFFAMAVFGGVLGSLLLLLRKKISIPVLIISLIGVLGQYGHMIFLTETVSVMGIGAMVLPLLVVIVSVALIPYALYCQKKRWLN